MKILDSRVKYFNPFIPLSLAMLFNHQSNGCMRPSATFSGTHFFKHTQKPTLFSLSGHDHSSYHHTWRFRTSGNLLKSAMFFVFLDCLFFTMTLPLVLPSYLGMQDKWKSFKSVNVFVFFLLHSSYYQDLCFRLQDGW